MAKPSNHFSFCSLLMAALFAYSASVQSNDPDWYFWIPLYVLAFVVNLMNCRVSSDSRRIRNMSRIALGIGFFLFFKVVIEDSVENIAGFWSLDLSERVIREKIGSGLVMASMALHLQASRDREERKRKKLQKWVDFGMVSLVGFSYALPFFYFVVQKGTMKF